MASSYLSPPNSDQRLVDTIDHHKTEEVSTVTEITMDTVVDTRARRRRCADTSMRSQVINRQSIISTARVKSIIMNALEGVSHCKYESKCGFAHSKEELKERMEAVRILFSSLSHSLC